MLRNRILTALVLVPLVVAGVLLSSTGSLALASGLVVVLGAREMARLAGIAGLPLQWLYAGIVGAALAWAYYALGPEGGDWLLLSAAVFWTGVTPVLLGWKTGLARIEGVRPFILALGAAQLLAAWMAIVRLDGAGPSGPALVLFLLVLIWTADSAAYFAGRAWGRHKLSPVVSPGKTREGAAGALLGAVAAALVLWKLALTPLSMPLLLLLCVLTAAVSIGGDLWESLLKRQAGLKDSGVLLPGHGGVLDRIDSLIAAAPVFTVGLHYLGGRV